jgi:ABC-2 type transport system permease protein
MWPICKKELRQAFSSLTGYIAIAVFLLVNGLVLFVLRNNILEFGYATLDQFFSFAPWILLFLISAITMRSFSDEFRSGTFELLQTRPISTGQIVAGKFFGAFIVALIALLPTLVYYFTVNHLAATTGIDAGAAIGSYLGLVLLTGVFTAIGICVSSFTNNSVVAFIISLIACVLFYYGFSAISELPVFQNGVDYYIEMLGINFHYQSISKGVTDTRDIVYFISLILFFLLLTKTRLEKQKSSKARKNPVRWIALVAALFVINFIASKVHFRKDLTEEKRYSLSSTTKELLRNINEPIKIEVFLKGEFPAGFKKLSNSVEEFLRETKEYSGSKLEYVFTDPLKGLDDSTAKYSIDSIGYYYDIPAFTLQAPSKVGDEQSQKLVLPGAVIHYRDTSIGINFFKGEKSFGSEPEQLAALYNNVEASMEYKFANALQKISLEKKPTVGYALGHGEGWGYNVDDAVRTLIKNYQFDTVNIRKIAAIPQFDALIILKPTLSFNEAEKLKIDQYVMHGGKVFWMIDNMYTEFDSLYQSQGFIAFDRGLNLDDILFNYGVRLNQSLLQDMQADKLPQISTNGSQQQRLVDWPFFPILNGTNHPISKNLDGVRLMFPTVIDTVEANGIKKTILLQSSENARTLEAPAKIDFSFLQIAPDIRSFQKKNIPTSILLEGKFSSLYSNRVSKAVQDSMNRMNYPFMNSNNSENRMIIVSDGDVAMNQFSQTNGPLPMGTNIFTKYTYANKDFYLNCLDYLVNHSDILQIRSKEVTLRRLDTKKAEAEKTKWQLINIALPILLIIIFGIVYQQTRRRRFAS